jgi:hypothetical protein
VRWICKERAVNAGLVPGREIRSKWCDVVMLHHLRPLPLRSPQAAELDGSGERLEASHAEHVAH